MNVEEAIVKRLSFSPTSFALTPPPAAVEHIRFDGTRLNDSGTRARAAANAVPQTAQSAGSPLARGWSAPVDTAGHAGHNQSGAAAARTPAAVRYGLLDGGERTTRSQRRGGACFRAPDSCSDDGDDDDEASLGPLSQPAPIEQLIQQLQEQWQALSLAAHKDRSEARQREFADTERRLAAELAAIAEQMRQKEVKQREIDQRKQQVFSVERDRKLRELQERHAETAAQQRQQVLQLQRAAQAESERAAAEAAARQAAAEAAAAAEAKVKAAEAAAAAAAAEAERARKEQLDKAAAAEREAAQQRQQQEAQQRAQEAAAAQSAAAAAPAAPRRHPCERIAPDAAADAAAVAATMASLEQLIAPLLADDNLKKQRRDIEKKMNVHVQQISATLEQIAKKCQTVFSLICQQPSEAWSVFAMITFVDKVMAQYELIQVNKRAAFPIATVLVSVSTQFPQLMQVTLAKLHREVPLTIPRSAVFVEGQISQTRYRKLIGMKVVEGEGPSDSKAFEGEGEYYKRLEGLMLLYGAIVQVDQVANAHGLDYGWRYLARFLNHLPADKLAAKALEPFLHSAGYGLHNRYRGQFVKLLKCMYKEYLPQLETIHASEVQSVRVRLQHYLTNAEFQKEPEGRNMPKIDMSTFIRSS